MALPRRRRGARFPGGGVERGESIRDALNRELAEEAGIEIASEPELFGIYSNARHFPGDHIALFVIRDWRQPHVPPPNREIAEQAFFDADALPADIHPPTRDRIGEVLFARPRSDLW